MSLFLRKLLLTTALAVLALFLASCAMVTEIIEIATHEEEDPLDIYEDERRRQDVRDYTFYRTKDLIPLKNGHYEAWIYQENAFISTGKFNINRYRTMVKSSGPDKDVGRITDLKGDVIMDGRFENKESFNHPEKTYISIEPNGDEDSIPSLFLLAGDVEKRKASLDLQLFDRSQTSGTVHIGNCIDTDCSAGESGAWFFEDSKDEFGREVKIPSLTLPNPPEGFIYEGWVEMDVQGKPINISLGKFSTPSGRDNSNLLSNGKQGPLFPGDDVLSLPPGIEGIETPVDLIKNKAILFITLQPFIDGVDQTPNVPFPIRLLEADLSKAQPGRSMQLAVSEAPFPTADLFIR